MISATNKKVNLQVVDITQDDNISEILNKIPIIFSKIKDIQQSNDLFKTVNLEKLSVIEQTIHEINDKVYNFGKKDSNFTRKLLTLQMLNTPDSTYRVLRQILAQIEAKRKAILENYYKLLKSYNEVVKLRQQIDNIEDKNSIEYQELVAEFAHKYSNMLDVFVYLEGAIKEVGLLEDAYNQIKKNKNIPDDWDEYDFEKAEVKAHIRNAFRNGIRDFLVHNSIGMGTLEYFEQLGISPFEAIYYIKNYLAECNSKMQNNNIPDYDEFQDFLDEMAERFKDNYKKACKRLGLDENYISDLFIRKKKND